MGGTSCRSYGRGCLSGWRCWPCWSSSSCRWPTSATCKTAPRNIIATITATTAARHLSNRGRVASISWQPLPGQCPFRHRRSRHGRIHGGQDRQTRYPGIGGTCHLTGHRTAPRNLCHSSRTRQYERGDQEKPISPPPAPFRSSTPCAVTASFGLGEAAGTEKNWKGGTLFPFPWS